MSSWEAACKKCGRCCMTRVKLPGGGLRFPGGRCFWLKSDGLCAVYERRFKVNPKCIKVTPDNARELGLPDDCGLIEELERWRKER